MNREEYIKFRSLNIITPVAYDFFQKNSKIDLPYEQFKRAFELFLLSGAKFSQRQVIIYEDEQHREIGRKEVDILVPIDWNLLWAKYDAEFELTFVTDLKTNKIIKIL